MNSSHAQRHLTLRLNDGRLLGYAQWGSSGGSPVFYFHGVPGSRLERWGGESAYAQAGVRLVTVDRPGIGRSTARPSRGLLAWCDDIAELADALKIDRFAVMGHSAGGAYALACAAGLTERVTRLALVGCVPRLDRPNEIDNLGTSRYWRLARDRPATAARIYRALRLGLRLAPRTTTRAFLRGAPASDYETLLAQQAAQRFQESVLEATRPGTRGLVDDMRVLMRPWDLDPADIKAHTFIWQGDEDHHVPVDVERAYSETIPSSEIRIVSGEGHFSLIENHAPAILRCLIDQHHKKP